MTHLYIDPNNKVWNLDQDAFDRDGGAWEWDGGLVDDAAGPELHSVAQPLLHMPLLGLAKFCGLHQLRLDRPEAHWMDPLDAVLDQLAPHPAPADLSPAESAEGQVA